MPHEYVPDRWVGELQKLLKRKIDSFNTDLSGVTIYFKYSFLNTANKHRTIVEATYSTHLITDVIKELGEKNELN